MILPVGIKENMELGVRSEFSGVFSSIFFISFGSIIAAIEQSTIQRVMLLVNIP